MRCSPATVLRYAIYAIALGALIGVTYFDINSHRQVIDYKHFDRTRHVFRNVMIILGGIQFATVSNLESARWGEGRTIFSFDAADREWHEWQVLDGWGTKRYYRFLGFRWLTGDLVSSTDPGSKPFFSIRIPFWPLELLAASVLLAPAVKDIRVRLRRRRGLCVQCGYDLRGIAAICPECGRSRNDAISTQ